MIRFIGIVCWFLALFILIDGAQERKKAEKEEEQQNTIVQQMESKDEAEMDDTIILPSDD